MNVEKFSISLPSEAMTQLIFIQTKLVSKGLRVSRSAVISACVSQVYEMLMIEENQKNE